MDVALVRTGTYFSGCGKSNSPQPDNSGGRGVPGVSTGTKASVDLNMQLLAVGASVVINNILFIYTSTGNAATLFADTQAICPHQGRALNFIQASNYIHKAYMVQGIR